MMLSVCIPVHNFPVTDFVLSLKQQCDACDHPVEILVYDDASTPEWLEVNRALLQIDAIRYLMLPDNVGRSRIRNKMAEDAKGDYLLFLDGDSAMEHGDFIGTYVRHCRENTLLYGGCSYQREKPENPEYFLRWLYGQRREAVPYETRRKNPGKYFTGNNFALQKDIFLEHPMNTNIHGYGYEDSLLLANLKQSGVFVQQLDNPLRHTGLEPARIFLEKTDEAISNLAMLVRKNLAPDNIRLLKYRHYANKMGLSDHIYRSFTKRKSQIMANLLGSNPQLSTFDFYKLATLAGHLRHAAEV